MEIYSTVDVVTVVSLQWRFPFFPPTVWPNYTHSQTDFHIFKCKLSRKFILGLGNVNVALVLLALEGHFCSGSALVGIWLWWVLNRYFELASRWRCIINMYVPEALMESNKTSSSQRSPCCHYPQQGPLINTDNQSPWPAPATREGWASGERLFHRSPRTLVLKGFILQLLYI